MPPLGHFLIVLGVTFVLLGILTMLPGFSFLGRLPGDITVQRGPVTIVIPIVTSLLISVILTILLSVFLRR